jgi:hypothetical protein
LPRGEHAHLIKLQLCHGRFDQSHMGPMRGVECSAKNAQALHMG